MRPSRPGGSLASVEVFRQQLMRGISTHIAGFTVLLVVVVPLLNFITLSSGDGSMLAWVTILADYTNSSERLRRREVNEFV
eukprot:CAMPEP_0172742576 /NCGR_PEP_ID=MMETSP1074-20121228/129894_1 /TAXON_ID=2916 /ORGANISM="Ceratium fusus, Strain PA161109" /LENGTH=80 /DNA_ID=CAMNT_0013573151 /DNA_START=1 /DNA_END=240 /DNA_ORIENTATION=+